MFRLNVCSVPRAASRAEGVDPAVAGRGKSPHLQAGQLRLGPVHQEIGLAQAGEETEAPVETGPASAVNLPGERGGGRDQSTH